MTEDRIYLNGIDGSTGNYLVPPLSTADVLTLARRMPREGSLLSWFTRIRKVLERPFVGLPSDVEPRNVSQAGWAIVFTESASQELRKALEPLMARRRTQVPPDRFRVLEYHQGEAMGDWLKRHGVAEGSINPKKIPYYVLLIGDPTEISFDFQYLLDIEYAVGRVAFDRIEQYRQYAESVVAYEKVNSLPNGREAVYWGTRHDPATELSADHLITPLVEGGSDEPPITEVCSFNTTCLKGPDATKANLLEVLHRSSNARPPAILFTASHGMGWPKEEVEYKRQRAAHGALLCQDWPGIGWPMQPSHYLTASEIDNDARLHGLVAFFFACYGAGTPAFDNFLLDRKQRPLPIADQPFVAALPQRLLSHPQGGCLAVIGHVERAWGYSIRPPGVTSQLVPFRNLISRILSGEPVGHATKDFSERYAILSAQLLRELDTTQPRPEESDLAWKWIERTDAQNYVVLGDPAVRIRVETLV